MKLEDIDGVVCDEGSYPQTIIGQKVRMMSFLYSFMPFKGSRSADWNPLSSISGKMEEGTVNAGPLLDPGHCEHSCLFQLAL